MKQQRIYRTKCESQPDYAAAPYFAADFSAVATAGESVPLLPTCHDFFTLCL